MARLPLVSRGFGSERGQAKASTVVGTVVSLPAATGIAATDTARIAGALTQAKATGGTVKAGAGTYMISATQQVPSGVVVEGVGEGATVFTPSGFAGPVFELQAFSSIAPVTAAFEFAPTQGVLNGLRRLSVWGGVRPAMAALNAGAITDNRQVADGIFVHDTDWTQLDDVEVAWLAGYGVKLGAGPVRESLFNNVRLYRCGNSSSSKGSLVFSNSVGPADQNNILHFNGLEVLYPHWVGIYADQTGDQTAQGTRLLYFKGGTIEAGGYGGSAGTMRTSTAPFPYDLVSLGNCKDVHFVDANITTSAGKAVNAVGNATLGLLSLHFDGCFLNLSGSTNGIYADKVATCIISGCTGYVNGNVVATLTANTGKLVYRGDNDIWDIATGLRVTTSNFNTAAQPAAFVFGEEAVLPASVVTDTRGTAEGDTLAYDLDESKFIRVPVGSNGQVLTADSATDGGVKWAAGGGGGSYDGWGSTFINVKDAPYNAAGDGVTNDTAAIQAAIDAVITAGGGTVYFPAGTYLVAGALVTSYHSLTFNAQLCLWGASSTNIPTVTLRGPDQSRAFEPTTGAITGGATIKSNLTGSGTNPALLAGPVSGTPAFVNLVLEDLTWRTPANPTLAALDLHLVYNSSGSRVLIDTPDGYSTVTQPTHPAGVGLVMGDRNTTGPKFWRDVLIKGYYTGLILGENGSMDNLIIQSCYVAIAPFNTPLPIHIGYIFIGECPYGVAYSDRAVGLKDDDEDTRIYIDFCTGENHAAGGGAWTALVADVYDHYTPDPAGIGGRMVGSIGFADRSAGGFGGPPVVVAYRVHTWTLGNTERSPVVYLSGFLNGWSAVSGHEPRAYIDRSGFVHLMGTVTGGTLGSPAFTLPRPFQPAGAGTEVFLAYEGGGGTGVGVTVGPGTVTVYNNNVNLNGITYPSSDRV